MPEAAAAVAQAAPAVRTKVAFVESKPPNARRIAELLLDCEAENQWANGGPVYRALRASYRKFLALGENIDVLPCANAGIGLELLGRLHEHKAGRRLRWIASSFSFWNVGRGYFADTRFCDCTSGGMLDLQDLAKQDPGSYDGIIVTNVFGLWTDFGPYIDFATKHGKVLLIDNAAGLGQPVPNHPWQAFSLHHTKPFGAGEGGLITVPAEDWAMANELMTYGPMRAPLPLWLNNGKISDIACAYLLDRLERFPDWGPRHSEQAQRVVAIAERMGFTRLFPYSPESVATSLPFLGPQAIELPLPATPLLALGKYYKPLAATPNAAQVFSRIVNIPSHPDVAQLSTAELESIFRALGGDTGTARRTE